MSFKSQKLENQKKKRGGGYNYIKHVKKSC